MRSKGLPSDARALLLAFLLLLLPLRRSRAEDRFDLKSYFYKEDGARVQSWGPSFHLEMDLNPETTLKIGGVYDVISGATPTGAPLTRKTHAVTVLVPVESSATGGATTTTTTTTNVVSGASGKATTTTTTTTTTAAPAPTQPQFVKQVVQVPYGKKFLPTVVFNDQRIALDAALSRRIGDYILTAGVATSDEADYNSLAASLKLDREFNNKNTVVSAAFSETHDLVKNVAVGGWDTKDTLEMLAGVSQVLDARTLFTLNYTFGTQSGYLDDQYKVAMVGDELLPDHRPGWRDKHVIDAVLTHFFDCLNGSIEGGYRYYRDSFGVSANTFDLKWNQKIGKQIIISPGLRYYEQSAADFYAVQFASKPQFYSADYRLSKLATLGYGVTVSWRPSPKFAVDASYERYSMWGRDGVTYNGAYPDANMVTLGFKVWF